MGKRWLLPALLVLAAVITGVVWQSRTTVEPDAQRPSSANAIRDRVPLALQWHVGVAQRYRLRSESSVHMDAATSNRSSIDVLLHGLLDTLTLEAGHDDVVVGMKLSGVELKINNTVDAETNRALAIPFRVHFSADGMPIAFDFPAEVSVQNRKMLENLVRVFQVSIKSGAETWVAQEANGNGAYEAVYSRSGPMQIDKAKRNFSAPSASMLAGAGISSTERLRIDPASDWLNVMHVDEKLATTSQQGPALTISNQASLELQANEHVAVTPDLWRFEAAAAAVDDAVNKITHPVPKISADEARKQIGLTVPELDRSTEGRMVLVHRLRDLLRVDDSLPAYLLELLRTQSLSDRTRADLYLVFEEAGTDGAQEALVSVFTDNSTWSFKDNMRAIVAMAGVDEPNQGSIAALWNTALNNAADGNGQRIVSAATFALGSLGNTMKDSANPDYESLRSSLLNNALSGVNAQQRSDFLLAVGNTQDNALAHEIVDQLDDAAPSVRRATAESLGMLGVDQTADTLVSRFQREDSGQVRSAIAESLGSWSQPTASAMAMFRQAVTAEVDESARYNVAILLGRNMGKFPENATVLKALVRTEPSKRIRQKVADMLSAAP